MRPRYAFGAAALITLASLQGDEVRDARELVDRGHPWRATQTITPVLRDSARRTPEALLVAARAAFGWGGVEEVDRLIGREVWVDSAFEGEARELLTRSALDRGQDSVALMHAGLAARDARSPQVQAKRVVLLARALERNKAYDSAAVTYAAAARSLQPVSDWLLLRAAGTTRDSVKRAALFARINLGVARPRIAWTEAQARERFGDTVGAAARFESLGAAAQAFRLRLGAASEGAQRDSVKRTALEYVRTHRASTETRTVLDAVERASPSLTPAEALVVARSAAISGPVARAVAAFGRAATEPDILTPDDRLQFGELLSRAGRSRDAAAQFALVRGPLAGQAAYQTARALRTSSNTEETRAALREVVTRFPRDTNAASAALYFLADLSTDVGDDAGARADLQRLYTLYPTSNRANDARLGAAIIALAKAANMSAASELDTLAQRATRGDVSVAARYWAGRAWDAAGNPEGAQRRWHDVIARDPLSYYAVLARERLREPAWAPPAGADAYPTMPAVDSAMQRIDQLDALGMDAEARFEYDALSEATGASPDRLLAAAHAMLEHGQASRAMRLAQRLIDGGQRDARVYRLLYPMIDRDELARDAAANHLDPALVAGLIRQESNFTPRATSIANARGLMQVLPSVGEEIAHALKFPTFNPALLYDADANLQLGTSHLSAFMQQYDALPRVLAAYNAGGSRVDRWMKKLGADDAELFTERIPFVETRDYVRIVQRNAAIYRALYEW